MDSQGQGYADGPETGAWDARHLRLLGLGMERLQGVLLAAYSHLKGFTKVTELNSP